jgi:hypothetical protein
MPIASETGPLQFLYLRMRLAPERSIIFLRMKTTVVLLCPATLHARHDMISYPCFVQARTLCMAALLDLIVVTGRWRSKVRTLSHSLWSTKVTQGFPGNMLTAVTYTLGPKSTWSIKIYATADHETPILLSGHHYWNLEAYRETQDLSGHYAWIDSSKIIATDGLLIPNGSYVDVNGTALDFRKGKSLGQAINDTGMHEYCGTGNFNSHWT